MEITDPAYRYKPRNENQMSKAKNQPSARQKLASVKPSGEKESSFFELVFEVARQIPRGRVTSYGAIAACLGSRLSARMVGWAMNSADKVTPRVPAHREIGRAS